MSLSLSVKAHKKVKARPIRERGTKPQTAYSKNMVRNCVYRLESRHGKHNLAFATYTLPELPEFYLKHLLENWTEVTRQFKQTIERELIKAGLKPEVVYITEIQMKRFRDTGFPIPHIHAVFQSRKDEHSPYAISKERNTLIWERIINNVLGDQIEHIPMPYATEIKTIRKSAEAYVSKYMSKGSDVANEIDNDYLRGMLPKSWWGATLSLRKWVKENTKVFTEATKEFIKANYSRWLKNVDNSPFKYLYVVEIENTDGRMIPVCLVGKIRKSCLHLFPADPLIDKPVPWAV
jgi:hypothetical protein